MNECIMLKDLIKGLIKKVWLSKYTKDRKRSMEESLKKGQTPKKTIEVVVGRKGKET